MTNNKKKTDFPLLWFECVMSAARGNYLKINILSVVLFHSLIPFDWYRIHIYFWKIYCAKNWFHLNNLLEVNRDITIPEYYLTYCIKIRINKIFEWVNQKIYFRLFTLKKYYNELEMNRLIIAAVLFVKLIREFYFS